MIGPELQKAIFDALVTGGICAGRIYDDPPADAVFPYITIGDEQVIDDGNTCGDAWEVHNDVHVWSRPDAKSRREAKEIAAAIVPLIAIELTVPGFRVAEAHHSNTRHLDDPDGITKHSIVSVEHQLDPA